MHGVGRKPTAYRATMTSLVLGALRRFNKVSIASLRGYM